MSTNRLNSEVRSQIVASVMKASKAGKALSSVESDIASFLDEMRAKYLGAPEEELEDLEQKVNKLLRPYLHIECVELYSMNRYGAPYCYRGPDSQQFYTNTVRFRYQKMVEMVDKKRVLGTQNCNIKEKKDWDRLEKLLNRHHRAKEDWENMFTQVAATINDFYTVKKLIEAWPEVKEHVPEPVARKCTAVAVPRDLLNESLGFVSKK